MGQVRRFASPVCFIGIVFFVATFTSCGGGSGSTGGSSLTSGTGSTGGSGSTGGTGSGGSTFQARPFPTGNFFVRLPNEGTDGAVPAIAYNPVLKEMFVSNPSKNTVEVYSTTDGHRVGAVSVPGPAGLSFSPDYSKLAVGTITAYFYLVDPAALHVTAQVAVPSSLMDDGQGSTGLFPQAPFIMADGRILLAMEAWVSLSAGTLPSHVISYDPASGTFTPLDPPSGSIFSTPVRSLDGKYLVVSSNPYWFAYSTVTGSYSDSTPGFPATWLAANSDGSQFAGLVTHVDGTQEVDFWNRNPTSWAYVPLSQKFFTSPIFSRDGKYLYLVGMGQIQVLNTQDGSTAGYLQVSSRSACDVDENYHFLGSAAGGVFSIDVSHLLSASPLGSAQLNSQTVLVDPNVGPLSGGTQVSFISSAGLGSANGIDSSLEAYFAGTPATTDVVGPYNGSPRLVASAPPASAPGPVSVVLTDANNNIALLPDAYTYGPHILRISPNVVSTQGGDQITITAYGLPIYDETSIRITMGGLTFFANGSLQTETSSGGYPEETMTVFVPPSTPGWSDVTITTPDGSDTLKRGVQYLAGRAEIQTQDYRHAVYDASRDRFYLTGADNAVAVFDPGTQSLVAPMQSSSISPGAVLGSEAITTDNSKLVVADPTDATIVVFDLATGTSSPVNVLLPSDPPLTPGTDLILSVAVSAGNRAFVTGIPCVTNPVREIDLTSLSIQPRPDAGSSCVGPFPQIGSAAADGSIIAFESGAPVNYESPYVWRYDAASDSFAGPIVIMNAEWVGNPAVSGDGNVIVFGGSTLDQNQLPLVPMYTDVEKSALNDNGSLLYYLPAAGGLAEGLADTHNGHTFLSFNSTGGSAYNALAIDPSATKMLWAHHNGLSYYELSVVPLAIGTVSPTLTAGGSSITIRGSGFVSATSVTLGGQSAACTFIDTETLTCAVPTLKSGPAAIALSNPDGQTYSFENAITVQ